jgi:hypothetical protein
MWPGNEADDPPLSNAEFKNVWCFRPTSILLMHSWHRCLQTHWGSPDSGSKNVNKPSCTHCGPPLRVTSKNDEAKAKYTDTATGRARCLSVCRTVPMDRRSNEVRSVVSNDCLSDTVLSCRHCCTACSAGGIVHCSVLPSAVPYQYSVVMLVVQHH